MPYVTLYGDGTVKCSAMWEFPDSKFVDDKIITYKGISYLKKDLPKHINLEEEKKNLEASIEISKEKLIHECNSVIGEIKDSKFTKLIDCINAYKTCLYGYRKFLRDIKDE